MRLLAAVLFACFTSIAVTGLFLPVYGVIVGDGHSCLAGPYGGWRECLRSIPISALIYGPLFAIFGTFIETPIAWALIKLRD